MNHITTELVEKIAAARVNAHAAHYGSMPEADRAIVPDFVLQTWDQQDEITQNGVRETVLNQLNEITPHLIDAGWLPPACESCQHPHGTDVCGSGLGGDSICRCQTEGDEA